MNVVADATPLHYLILIGHAHVLPALFARVIVPPAVLLELSREQTPLSVRVWLANRPDWLRVHAPRQPDPFTDVMGRGEREAIALAEELSAGALLVDDGHARREAKKRNIPVLGTLRVLADAAEHGSADLLTALVCLAGTNFRANYRLIRALLARHP